MKIFNLTGITPFLLLQVNFDSLQMLKLSLRMSKGIKELKESHDNLKWILCITRMQYIPQRRIFNTICKNLSLFVTLGHYIKVTICLYDDMSI